MITFRTRRQTERAGLDPTLSVMVADKGIALEKLCNQYTCDVCKEYTDNSGNPLFQRILNQVINHPTFETKIGLVYAITLCQSRKSRISFCNQYQEYKEAQ